MRYVDVNSLPKRKYGNGFIIDWEKSVGKTVSFIYDGIKGKFKIENHLKGNYIVISYKNKTKKMRTNHLMQFKFRELVFGNHRKLHYIDFSNIPIKNNKYDWKGSIGKEIPFSFNDIIGSLYIEKYTSKNHMGYLTVMYNNQKYDIRNINLLMGKISKIVSFGKYHFEISQKVNNVVILKRKKEYRGNIRRKFYKYLCKRCYYQGWIEESSLETSKIICSNCSNKIAVKGKSDIMSEAPWMIHFFQEKDQSMVYTERKTSNKKIYPICPNCKQIRKTPMQIGTIYKYHSIACPCCSDKVTYPEKFILEFFKQIKVNLIYQPKKNVLPWIENYFYDFYDPEKKIIIEVNGMHHYQHVKHYSRSLKEVKDIDRIKKALALKNNMKYIVIDARYSDLNYIKESLKNNKTLRKYYSFDIRKIDFSKCEYATIQSAYFKIYEYKKKHPSMTYKELSLKYGFCKDTISKQVRRIEAYLNKN